MKNPVRARKLVTGESFPDKCCWNARSRKGIVVVKYMARTVLLGNDKIKKRAVGKLRTDCRSTRSFALKLVSEYYDFEMLKSAGRSIEGPPGCRASPVSCIRCPLFLFFSILSFLLIILRTQYHVCSLLALSKY